MILLDTNVVSETMRQTPNSRVVAWLNAQVTGKIYLSTVSLAELLSGVALLPDGRRKSELASLLAGKTAIIFRSRILPFDARSAEAYAVIAARVRSVGRSISLAHGFIAAIAVANDLTVATRDINPFDAAGIPVINPWL